MKDAYQSLAGSLGRDAYQQAMGKNHTDLAFGFGGVKKLNKWIIPNLQALDECRSRRISSSISTGRGGQRDPRCGRRAEIPRRRPPGMAFILTSRKDIFNSVELQTT